MARFRYFAINVEKNTFRRNHILGQCKKYNIEVEIFNAITPETMEGIPHHYDPKRTVRLLGKELRPAEIACGLSHITLWRQLLDDQKTDAYVILEDDAQIDFDIAKLLEKADFSEITVLRLHSTKTRNRINLPVQSLTPKHSVIKLPYGLLGTLAYVITKPAAEKLIPYCEQFTEAIDMMYDRSYDHKVPIYAIVPYPVSHPTLTMQYTEAGFSSQIRPAQSEFQYCPSLSLIGRLKVCSLHLMRSSQKRLAEAGILLQKVLR